MSFDQCQPIFVPCTFPFPAPAAQAGRKEIEECAERFKSSFKLFFSFPPSLILKQLIMYKGMPVLNLGVRPALYTFLSFMPRGCVVFPIIFRLHSSPLLFLTPSLPPFLPLSLPKVTDPQNSAS